jgi:ketosteroid isomerase-like protein
VPTTRDEMVGIVQTYLDGLRQGDLSRTPLAPDVTYESPLSPMIAGREAVAFLEGLRPVIKDLRLRQSVVEGEHVACVFDFETIYGNVPVGDFFRIVDGRIKSIRPFYDPRPLTGAAAASTQVATLVARFEEANQELIGEIERLSDEEWARTCPGEGWPVGVTAHHVAASHVAVARLVEAIAAAGELPPITMDTFDQINAAHAREHAGCGRAETVELLRGEGQAAAAIVAGLRDEQLDRTASAAFLGGAEISARALIERVLIGHVAGHLESMRAAVAG